MTTQPQKIQVRRGDTVSYAGTVTLPANVNWSATCAFRDQSNRAYGLAVALELIGPNADNDSLNDFAIRLEATSLATANWPAPTNANYPTTFPTAIRFRDDSEPPIVKSSATFYIEITA